MSLQISGYLHEFYLKFNRKTSENMGAGEIAQRLVYFNRT